MRRLLIALVVAVALTFTISVGAVNYSKANDYKSQIAEAEAQCEKVKEEIKKDSDLINGKGFDEYCEKIAREKYGYAKPGEYVIYDSSFGN
ncbi:MAG: septum formation initiator family protein [Ruminococcus sp.]|nr:septum formation initiator family protein [Ruminococcus sp.]